MQATKEACEIRKKTSSVNQQGGKERKRKSHEDDEVAILLLLYNNIHTSNWLLALSFSRAFYFILSLHKNSGKIASDCGTFRFSLQIRIFQNV
jgi:hypothetical protein